MRNLTVFLVLLAILLIALFSYAEYLNAEKLLLGLQNYGLLGLFIATVLANASVLVIIPIDFVFFALGRIYNPVILAFLIGIGAAIGEMTSYIVGMGSLEAIKRTGKIKEEKIEEMKNRIGKKGMIIIFLGSMTPFPFDLIGIAAGMLHYNIYKFFIGTALGKIVRYGIIVYAGIFGLEIIQRSIL